MSRPITNLLLFAIAILLALHLMGATQDAKPQSIIARELRIVNDKGETLASLSGKDDSAMLALGRVGDLTTIMMLRSPDGVQIILGHKGNLLNLSNYAHENGVRAGILMSSGAPHADLEMAHYNFPEDASDFSQIRLMDRRDRSLFDFRFGAETGYIDIRHDGIGQRHKMF